MRLAGGRVCSNSFLWRRGERLAWNCPARNAIAIAAGATFVAREFSGKPNQLAETLTHAIRHPGFSFVQVLSPCPTFRPEQMEWKHEVTRFDSPELPTDDPGVAESQVCHRDSGLSTGIIFSTERSIRASRVDAQDTLDDIEAEFFL